MRRTPVQTAWRSVAFAAGAIRERELLAGVQTYVLFIGHARSGHSVIGALLDAHRQIVISDETLKPIFGGKARISMFEITGLVSDHLS